MKIFKLQVENFRLLKNFNLDLEKDLSLVIGKNNTGKTSLLAVLDKFLNEKGKFSFDDLNIEYKGQIKRLVEDPALSEADYQPTGIKLRLFVSYDAHDNLSNVSRLMMDLDPANNVIVLGFENILGFEDYTKLRADFLAFNINELRKVAENANYAPKGLPYFLQHNVASYFKHQRKSFEYSITTKTIDEKRYIDLATEDISTKDVINFKYISARRDVTNKDIDTTLSKQTSRIYKSTEATDEQNKAVDDFKDRLSETDTHLSGIYVTLFQDIIKKVQDFGGIKLNESEIGIISTLQHRELLEGNTTVVYQHDADNQLPEHYNGLGYMNLISMIFEIEIIVHEFKRAKDQRPADINLLFIEEPEAHTHPQMQYIFIKNIKNLLKEGIKREDGENRKLQYIISTHSSHIVADSDFDDIKYLKKETNNRVIAKNLCDLAKEYDSTTNQYKFLKQYLTISRAEIFFADKAILIEGDTERILVPTIMRKVDFEEKARLAALNEVDNFLPLLSQNISIVEVGAYSQIFEKFVDFLGIKSLIITDLDAVDADDEKCTVSAGVNYSNEALRFFFNDASLNDLKGFSLLQKLFNKVGDTWVQDANGRLCITYQTAENGFHARSFEDAYIHLNRDFISARKITFLGLKNRDYIDAVERDAYFLAERCVKKKTHFALDIIYHSNEQLTNWVIPAYIKDGLLWLKKD